MQLVLQFYTDAVYLMGDSNLVPSSAMDSLHTLAHDSLTLWADTFALPDVWRHMYPNLREFTFHSTTYKTLSKIDLVFASNAALPYVRGISVLPRGISDHAPCVSPLPCPPP